MIKKYCYILTAILLAYSCKKEASSQYEIVNTFPNQVGDHWLYQINDTAYFLQNPGSITQKNLSVTITGTTVLPGGIAATVWVYQSPGFSDTNFVFQKGDTVCFAANHLPAIDILKQYILPLALHNIWKYTANSIHPVAIDSQANILVGSLFFNNALHITGLPGRPDELFSLTEWFAPGAGLVNRSFNNVHSTNSPNQHSTSWTLLSYHVQ